MNVTKLRRLVLCTFVFLSAPLLYGGIPQSWYSSTPTNKNLTAATFGQGQFLVSGFGSLIIKSADGFAWRQSLRPNGLQERAAAITCTRWPMAWHLCGRRLRQCPDDFARCCQLDEYSKYRRPNDHLRAYVCQWPFCRRRPWPQLNTAYIATSANGIDWQYPTAPTANTLRGVAFGNNLYVSVGDLGRL